MTERIWSPQQQAFFQWGRVPNLIGRPSHLIGRARAGTGKTTTLEAMVQHMPEKRVIVTAYNKRIVLELKRRGLNAQTVHSLGLRQVKFYWPDVGVNFSSDREQALTNKIVGVRAPDPIKHLISKLHTKGREIAPHARELGDLTDLQIQHELEPDEEYWDAGFTPAYVEEKALLAMEEAAKFKPVGTGIDGADMIFLPVRNHWLTKIHDGGIVDEAQDMSAAMLELFMGIVRGRMAMIGDDRQAIYGWRGADSNALDRLKRELRAEELPLTYTRRCAQRIVELAKIIVPDFEAWPDNPDGDILEVEGMDALVQMAGPGDFILSRLNAPLVSVAMRCLRLGKRTQIAGKNIGAGLLALVRKLRAPTVEDFLIRLRAWREREIGRLVAAGREDRVEIVNDKADMLIELSEGRDNMPEVVTLIESLFTKEDDITGVGIITCSSVHKAKGLEADRVFILKDTLRSHNQEELNIQYVAITRAKSTLVWVQGVR